MTPESVIIIGQQALVVTAMLSAPLLLAALAAGLVIGMFQAATQINEVTLSFIPKLLGARRRAVLGRRLDAESHRRLLGIADQEHSVADRLSMQIPLEVIEALLGNVLASERVAVLPHRGRHHGGAGVRRAPRADARAPCARRGRDGRGRRRSCP